MLPPHLHRAQARKKETKAFLSIKTEEKLLRREKVLRKKSREGAFMAYIFHKMWKFCEKIENFHRPIWLIISNISHNLWKNVFFLLKTLPYARIEGFLRKKVHFFTKWALTLSSSGICKCENSKNFHQIFTFDLTGTSLKLPEDEPWSTWHLSQILLMFEAQFPYLSH